VLTHREATLFLLLRVVSNLWFVCEYCHDLYYFLFGCIIFGPYYEIWYKLVIDLYIDEVKHYHYDLTA